MPVCYDNLVVRLGISMATMRKSLINTLGNFGSSAHLTALNTTANSGSHTNQQDTQPPSDNAHSHNHNDGNVSSEQREDVKRGASHTRQRQSLTSKHSSRDTTNGSDSDSGSSHQSIEDTGVLEDSQYTPQDPHTTLSHEPSGNVRIQGGTSHLMSVNTNINVQSGNINNVSSSTNVSRSGSPLHAPPMSVTHTEIPVRHSMHLKLDGSGVSGLTLLDRPHSSLSNHSQTSSRRSPLSTPTSRYEKQINDGNGTIVDGITSNTPTTSGTSATHVNASSTMNSTTVRSASLRYLGDSCDEVMDDLSENSIETIQRSLPYTRSAREYSNISPDEDTGERETQQDMSISVTTVTAANSVTRNVGSGGQMRETQSQQHEKVSDDYCLYS